MRIREHIGGWVTSCLFATNLTSCLYATNLTSFLSASCLTFCIYATNLTSSASMLAASPPLPLCHETHLLPRTLLRLESKRKTLIPLDLFGRLALLDFHSEARCQRLLRQYLTFVLVKQVK